MAVQKKSIIETLISRLKQPAVTNTVQPSALLNRNPFSSNLQSRPSPSPIMSNIPVQQNKIPVMPIQQKPVFNNVQPIQKADSKKLLTKKQAENKQLVEKTKQDFTKVNEMQKDMNKFNRAMTIAAADKLTTQPVMQIANKLRKNPLPQEALQQARKDKYAQEMQKTGNNKVGEFVGKTVTPTVAKIVTGPIGFAAIGALEGYSEKGSIKDAAIEAGTNAAFGGILKGGTGVAKAGLSKVAPNLIKTTGGTIAKNFGASAVGGGLASGITGTARDLLKGDINLKDDAGNYDVNKVNEYLKQKGLEVGTSALLTGLIGGYAGTKADFAIAKSNMSKDAQKVIEDLQKYNTQINRTDQIMSSKLKQEIFNKGQTQLNILANSKYAGQDKNLKELVNQLQLAYKTGNIQDIDLFTRGITGYLGDGTAKLIAPIVNNQNINPVQGNQIIPQNIQNNIAQGANNALEVLKNKNIQDIAQNNAPQLSNLTQNIQTNDISQINNKVSSLEEYRTKNSIENKISEEALKLLKDNGITEISRTDFGSLIVDTIDKLYEKYQDKNGIIQDEVKYKEMLKKWDEISNNFTNKFNENGINIKSVTKENLSSAYQNAINSSATSQKKLDFKGLVKNIFEDINKISDNNFSKQIAQNISVNNISQTNKNIVQNKNTQLNNVELKSYSTGSHSGQVNITTEAIINGKTVGKLEYNIYDNKPSIEHIEIQPGYRRKGIATQLLQNLQQEYPNIQIEWGSTTLEGTFLKDSITYNIENKDIIQKQNEINEIDKTLEEYQKKEDNNILTKEEAENWNNLYDRKYKLEQEIEGKDTHKNLISINNQSNNNFSKQVDEVKTTPKKQVNDKELTETEQIKQDFGTRDKANREFKKLYDDGLNKEEQRIVEHIFLDLEKGNITREEISEHVNKLKGNINRENIINTVDLKNKAEDITTGIDKVLKDNRNKYKELAENLSRDMFNWKDKKIPIQYDANTPQRNLKDIMPKETAETVNKALFKPIIDNNVKINQEKIQYNNKIKELNISQEKKYDVSNIKNAVIGINKLNPDTMDIANYEKFIKENPTTKASESNLIPLFIERKITEKDLQDIGADVEKIKNADKVFREIFDNVLEKINQVRVQNGYTPINKRKDYNPHFNITRKDDLLNKALKTIGIEITESKLPTEIAGKTEHFKPRYKMDA